MKFWTRRPQVLRGTLLQIDNVRMLDTDIELQEDAIVKEQATPGFREFSRRDLQKRDCCQKLEAYVCSFEENMAQTFLDSETHQSFVALNYFPSS